MTRLETDTQLHPGVILKDRLAKLGISQSECAAALGVSRGYVSDLILGKRNLSAEMCMRLADYFYADEGDYWFRLQQSYDYEQFLTASMQRRLDRAS